ncbi:HTH_Tnp_Tc3_2 domain-containing protein [Trichonephila clavipes]|nr:HTH_Tnp_Tc3_2 domain-containing protein [Trichonephila clavipes]
MFSDESMFSLQSDSRRTLIRRASGTRYHQENTIERHPYGGAGWLVWGGIILGSKLTLFSVTMTTCIGIIFWNNMYICFGAPWVLNLWMTSPSSPWEHCNAFNRRISPVWIGQHTHRT